MIDDYFLDVLDRAPVLIWRSGPDTLCNWFNQSWLAFTGRKMEQEVGEGWIEDVHPDDVAECAGGYLAAFRARERFELTYRIRRHDGEYRWIVDRGQPHYSPEGDFAGYFGFCFDVTQRSRTEKIQEARLGLMQYAETHTLDDVLSAMLQEISQLTDSQVGFYHFMDMDESTILRTTWSTTTLKQYCNVEGMQGHKNADQAGVWAESIRLRRPVIHNDYASLVNRAGLPEGHSPLVREMIAPVFRNDKIVAVLGIGNKPIDYNQDDLEVVSQFADLTWSIVEKKSAARSLELSEARFRALFETMAQGVVYQVHGGHITAANLAAERILGLTLAQMQGRTSIDPRWKSVHEDGSDFPGESYPAMIALRTGAPVNDVVMGVYHPLDNTHHWILVNAFPQFHANSAEPYEVCATFTDITSRAQMERDLRHRAAELEVLFDLSQGLRSAQKTDEIMRIALDHAKRLVSADCGAIIMYDTEDEQFTIEAADGPLADDLGEHIGKDEGLCGLTRRNDQPIQSQNYDAEPHKVEMSVAARYLGPVVCAPLRSEVGFQGVIVTSRLRSNNPQRFSDGDLSLLAVAGEMVGTTLRRAQLFEQTISNLQRIQALRSVDIAIKGTLDSRVSLNILLETITSQLGVSAADVLLFNTDLLRLEYTAGRGFLTGRLQKTVVNLHSDPVGRAAIRRQILTIPDLRNATDFRRIDLALEEGFVSYCCLPLSAKGELLGVIEVFNRSPLTFTRDWLDYLEALADQASISIDNARMFENLERTNLEMRLAYEATIEGWSKAVDLRDSETEGHSQRVADMTVDLARRLGVSNDHIMDIRRGALLHDIGKIGVPDAILTKPGNLTPEEREIMNKHTQYAYDMLSPIIFLGPAISIPYCHHESWDGAGYPRGLKGEQIPIEARIFAVVDVYDALSSDRHYRKAWPQDKVILYMLGKAGVQFDPLVVKMFIEMLTDKR